MISNHALFLRIVSPVFPHSPFSSLALPPTDRPFVMTVELSITSMALFLIVLVPALKMALGVFVLFRVKVPSPFIVRVPPGSCSVEPILKRMALLAPSM